jgi:four helix bundle protein
MNNVKFHEKDISERTFSFGLRIIKLVLSLPRNSVGNALGNQIIRSGTSIGANIEEAQDALSKKDFIHSMTISLKEARETHFWLRMISESNLLSKNRLTGLMEENVEIIKILITIVKNSKNR